MTSWSCAGTFEFVLTTKDKYYPLLQELPGGTSREFGCSQNQVGACGGEGSELKFLRLSLFEGELFVNRRSCESP